jgi:hypothetical protein
MHLVFNKMLGYYLVTGHYASLSLSHWVFEQGFWGLMN